MEEQKPQENLSKPQENLSIVDEAKKIRDEIRAENDRREKILADEQKLQAERMLGSSAGQPIPQKQLTEEDLKTQQAKEFWKGTAIEDALNKYNG
jgi:hypothetical protein